MSALKGGVGLAASMIVLEPEAERSKIVAHTMVPVSEEFYAMTDSIGITITIQRTLFRRIIADAERWSIALI